MFNGLKSVLNNMIGGLGENSVPAENLLELIKEDKSLVILDVRNKDELAGPMGKLKGSVNIPVDQLSRRVSELSKYKNRKIAVICHSGARSTMATKMLLSNEFNAINLSGGMLRYRMMQKN